MLLAALSVLPVTAQRTRRDTTDTKEVPVGMNCWRIEERFGQRTAVTPDTLMDYFPQRVFTAGPTMRYNFTGNYGAPRMSRVYSGQDDWMMGDQFLFSRPYDYFITTPSELPFTNTKSPFTTLTYNKCGTKTTGEDRITAQFAVNAGRKLGVGFLLDYLYGRGYYDSQNTGHFGGAGYASYIDERYDMHLFYGFNYLKNAENGGIEADEYITRPEILPSSYRTREIPVRLEDTYNYMRVNTLFLTHRYHLGDYPIVQIDTTDIDNRAHLDSTMLVVTATGDTMRLMPIREFRPMASIIHTLRLAHNNRSFFSRAVNDKFFSENYFALIAGVDSTTTAEKTRNFSLQNTLALEMREGFRKWVKTGMRIYAKHDYEHFTLMDKHLLMSSYNENYVTMGAQLMREQGKLFHFNVLGELRTTGKKWGEFNAEGWARFDIPLRHDSLTIKAYGYVRNEQPSFYFRHYHGRNAWWDNDLHNIFRTRVGGELRWHKTRLIFNLENTKNYTHFAHLATIPTPTNLGSLSKIDAIAAVQPRYAVRVAQASENIQTLEVTLRQDFRIGPLNWNNELTLQKSSSDEHLPLPLFTGYTNLFLKFRIAKVLNTEIGVDARYFTRYYAPDYNPAIGQFATQDTAARIKIGNYPWVNAYVNFHLKRARFYVMYTHLNKGSGPYFLTPHYPTNQRVLRLGVSWSFIN